MERYLGLIWHQVGEIHALDQLDDGRRGAFYHKGKPVTLASLEKMGGPGI